VTAPQTLVGKLDGRRTGNGGRWKWTNAKNRHGSSQIQSWRRAARWTESRTHAFFALVRGSVHRIRFALESGLTLFVDETKIPDVQIEQAEHERLWEQLYAENETISFLLKAHLYSEYWLDRLLAEYSGEKREPLERMRLRFVQKLSLVDSFALLPEECVRSLRALNKLRNDCVHTFNTRPTLEDVQKVGFELTEFQRATAEFQRTAGDIQSVEELLKAYMHFLLGYFSAAKYDLEQHRRV
jgi:hypothetical protein